MIGIVCLDQNNGMYFNERRQSRDRYVIRDITDMTKDSVLYINSYSEELFENFKNQYIVSNDYFSNAKENDYCFVENQILDESRVNKMVVYRWDKVYPLDYKLNLSRWKLISTVEFMGYSHDKIVKEVYVKDEKQKVCEINKV